MHTMEIDGRPIAVMNSSKDEAEDWFRGEAFKSDLLVLQGPGEQPLWDGKAPLFVRPSFPEEEAMFKRNFAKEVLSGDTDRDEEKGYLVFLLAVTDSTGDAFDGDGNLIE